MEQTVGGGAEAGLGLKLMISAKEFNDNRSTEAK